MPPVLNSPQMPSILLITGILSFSAAIVWTYTGKAWIRFHGWIYRAERPTRFWWEVAMYYLGGLFLIGLYLYKIHAL